MGESGAKMLPERIPQTLKEMQLGYVGYRLSFALWLTDTLKLLLHQQRKTKFLFLTWNYINVKHKNANRSMSF